MGIPPEVQNEALPSLLRQKLDLIDRLDAENRSDLSAPLEKCGQNRTFFCSHCLAPHDGEERCRRRYCPVCSRQIAARFTSRYRSTLATVRWPLFVTWTAHHSELFPLAGFAPLFDALKKLRHQTWWTKAVQGGIVSGEVSNSGSSGWHYHLHSILDTRWLAVTCLPPRSGADAQHVRRRAQQSMKEVRQQWELALGRPGSLKAQRCNGEEAAAEVLKYAVTPASLLAAPGEIGPVIDQIRKSRLVRSFGNMYGHLRDADEKPEPRACGACGNVAPQIHERVFDAMMRRGACG